MFIKATVVQQLFISKSEAKLKEIYWHNTENNIIIYTIQLHKNGNFYTNIQKKNFFCALSQLLSAYQHA